METGLILHTMGEYQKSIKVFEEADYIAETIKTSLSKELLSFFLSDRESNFKGENFERVLIKLYIALNYIMLNDYQRAKQYFKKLDFDLKWMKYTENKYKQNLFARYIDAIISEHLKYYNDARVQYKNIIMLDPENKNILADRYILAVKENDINEMKLYEEGKKYLNAYDTNLALTEYRKDMGELVIIYQAGKCAVKESRGKILDDQAFHLALRTAIEVAIRAEGAAVSTAGVLAMIANAENPIPVYKKREIEKSLPLKIFLNDKYVGETIILNDYSETTIKNFNDNYSEYIAKNVASIATKIVLAAVVANKASAELEKYAGNDFLVKNVGRFLIGAGTGATVATSIAPDLRCWRLLPSNFQVLRIFLAPGEYKLNFQPQSHNIRFSSTPYKILIRPYSLNFINFRSI
jgi:hypothetical protein